MVALFAIPFSASAASESASSVELSGGNYSALPGEQVTVKLAIEENVGFTYVKLAISYDESALTLLDFSNGNVVDDLTEGIYYIWSADDDVIESGILAELTFRVNEGAPYGDNIIDIEVVECSNVSEKDVSIEASDAKINVLCDHAYNPDKFVASVTPPTCTEAGYTTYTCSCGASYKADYVAPIAHSFAKSITPATCSSIGYTTYTCDCGFSYVADYELPLAHDYDAVVTAPDCVEYGYTTYTCDCGHSYVGDYVKPNGHTYLSVTVDSTCSTMGYTVYTCACGETYKGDYKAVSGHNYGEWKVDSQPTTTTPGEKHRECANGCGHVQTADIPAIPVEPDNTTEIVISMVSAMGIVFIFVATVFIGRNVKKKSGKKD